MRRSALAVALAGSCVMAACHASAQDYPNKPIRIITASPGGAADFVARLIRPNLSASLGQQVVVDNRGGGGIIAGKIVANAPPDGYTLLLNGPSIWIEPFFHAGMTYDPVRDFLPITLAASSPNILVVHPSLPVHSVRQLIDLAKARPGELNYGAASAGSSTNIAAALFNAMADIHMVNVAYKGTPQAFTDLIAGRLQVMFPAAGAVALHVKAGRLRALAVTSLRPSVLAPGLPTVAASGLPGYESELSLAILAPAKTPQALVSRLNREIVRILGTSEVRERLLSTGVEAVGSSPEELGVQIRSEMSRISKIIKDGRIRE